MPYHQMKVVDSMLRVNPKVNAKMSMQTKISYFVIRIKVKTLDHKSEKLGGMFKQLSDLYAKPNKSLSLILQLVAT
jgi:hypothetical protein